MTGLIFTIWFVGLALFVAIGEVKQELKRLNNNLENNEPNEKNENSQTIENH